MIEGKGFIIDESLIGEQVYHRQKGGVIDKEIIGILEGFVFAPQSSWSLRYVIRWSNGHLDTYSGERFRFVNPLDLSGKKPTQTKI